MARELIVNKFWINKTYLFKLSQASCLLIPSQHTDLDISFVVPLFWESLGQAMAHNLSYNHSVLFEVASFESSGILDYIFMIYFDKLSVRNF